MAKTHGLGAGLYIAQYDVSGDIQSVGNVSSPVTTLDVTGIDKEAPERLKGQIDGNITMTTFFNDDTDQVHDALSTLPRADRIVTYCHRTAAVGDPAASMIGKQINYDLSRGQDGSLTFAVQAQANGYGLEWGNLLTPGVRADGATATDGDSFDHGSQTTFGIQAYLHVFAIASGSATITVEDSADDAAWATVDTFSAVTAAGSERIQSGRTDTVDRYLRVTSTGTFTGLSFAVMVKRNLVSTLFEAA